MAHASTSIELLSESGQVYQHELRSWPFSVLEYGLPQGALIQIGGALGGGKTELLLNFLAENSQIQVGWIESLFTVYPAAFCSHKIDLRRILFLETDSFEWAAQQLLESKLFPLVILSAVIENVIVLRRLQIAAEKAQASVVLLTEQCSTKNAWPISVQLYVRRSPHEGSIYLTPIKYFGKRQWKPILLK